jgi:hypothetical protein
MGKHIRIPLAYAYVYICSLHLLVVVALRALRRRLWAEWQSCRMGQAMTRETMEGERENRDWIRIR